jgi:phosphoglucomutase
MPWHATWGFRCTRRRAASIPGPDGILACLLAAELVASRGGARLRTLLQELYAEVGTFVTKRLTLPLDSAGPDHLSERLSQPPGRLAGLAVIAVKRQDGLKILLEDGSWLLLRLSEREPEVRLCAEAETVEQLDRLLTAGEALIGR